MAKEEEVEFPSVIYKAPLELVDEEQVILLPNTAEILSIQVQGVGIYIWFQWYMHPDNGDDLKQWRFRVIGTGERFQASKLKFLATVQQPPFVWHIFQVKQP